MFEWLKNLMVGGESGTPEYELARQLYDRVVRQARQPVFFREIGVADTLPGRFEMVSLHMFILLDRLVGKDRASDEIAQQLVDVMFDDMDDVAREVGIGDMGVGPRIKKLARSFRSRLEYYKETIGGGPRGTLSDAILDVFFDKDKERRSQAKQLAAYVIKEQSRLGEMSLRDISKADPLFGVFEENKGKEEG